MKKINVTFSLPPETHKLLRSLVGQRKMSSFVSKAIEDALKEKKEQLKAAYIEAEQDPERKKTLEEWSSLEVEGWE